MKQTGISSVFSLIPSLFNKVDVSVINRYNQAIRESCNHEQALQVALTDTSGAQIKCNKSTYDAIAAANGHAIKLENLTFKSKAAALGMKALNWAMSTLVMVGVSWAFSKISESIQEAKQAQEEFRRSQIEAGKTADETNDKLQEYIATYHELAKTGGSADQLKDLQQQIADLVGVQADNLDLVNGKLDDELEKLQQISIEQAQKNKGDLTGALVSAEQDLEAAKGRGAYSGYSHRLFKIDDSLLNNSGFMSLLDSLGVAQKYSNTGEFTGSFTFAQDSAENLYKSYQAAVQAVTYLKDNVDKELWESSALYDELSTQIGKYSEAAKAYGDALNAYNQNEAIIAVGENLKTFKGEIKDEGTFKTWVKGIIKAEGATGDYADAIWEVCESRYPQFARESDKVANELNKVEDAAEGAANSMSEFAKALSLIQKLENGLNQLDEIYADILDGGDFDFGSILNNEEFTTAFGSLGEVYDDFIKTVANSPSDINACQNAFNNLVTAYLNNSDALKQVTADTKNATIAMLKQMGIANATAIVEKQLAINEEKATIQKKLQKDVYEDSSVTLQDFIDRLYNEADATDITREAYVNLIAQETIFNNKNLDVTQKIEQLERLAKQAGLTSQAIASVVTPTSALEKKGANVNDIAKQREEWLKNAGISWKKVGTTKNKAGAKVEDWVYTYNGKQYENFDSVASAWYANLFASNANTSYTKTSYSGGSSTKSVRDSGKTAEEKRKEEIEKHKEAAEAEIAKLKYKLETNQITEEQYLKDLDSAYKRFYNKTADYLEDYAKYSQEVYDGFKDMYKEDLEAQKEAWEKKKDAVSEYYDNLREQIDDAHDKEDYEKEQSEKRKEIFDLDMQIAELMRDGSEKAKARIAELEEERLKAEEELLDFETDKAREDELSRLEKEQEAEEKRIEEEIKGVQEKLDQLDKDTISVRDAIIAYATAQGVTLDFAYASGTRSSVGGFGRINEKGIEMIAAPDGNGNYVNLMPNSYVFSAKATEFLWKLATEHSLPQAMYNSIAKSIQTQSSTPSVNIAQPITITMGDVIIKGNADKQTVADIKRQQENTVRMVLQKIKELQK